MPTEIPFCSTVHTSMLFIYKPLPSPQSPLFLLFIDYISSLYPLFSNPLTIKLPASKSKSIPCTIHHILYVFPLTKANNQIQVYCAQHTVFLSTFLPFYEPVQCTTTV